MIKTGKVPPKMSTYSQACSHSNTAGVGSKTETTSQAAAAQHLDVKAHAKAVEDLHTNFAKQSSKTAAISSRILPDDLDQKSESVSQSKKGDDKDKDEQVS